MFLSCLFEGNILDSNMRALSLENVEDLGLFDKQIITTKINPFLQYYCVTWSFPLFLLCFLGGRVVCETPERP